MARSRRPAKRRSFQRKGPKADWVYRGDVHDSAGGLVENFGTYVPGAAFTQTPGLANGTIHWLYDSANYRQFSVGAGGVNTGFRFPSPYRAEGRNPLILRVQGWIAVNPSVWAVGSVYWLGMRFGVFTQSAQTGNGIFPAGYSLWSYPTNDLQAPPVYANTRTWVRELRHVEHFNDNSQRKNFRINIKLRRRLLPDQGFGVYTETADGSVNIGVLMALRSLVVDEG